jgi:hypothetical protein
MVVLTLLSVVVLPHFMNPDVAMYTDIGHRLLDGERPYVDYEEINFPMIHVLNILPAALTRLTGLPATITLQACIVALLFVSLGLMWRLLSQYSATRSVAAVTVLGVVFLAWLLFINFHWGEREHLFTLFYLPFVILRVIRREGQSVGRGMALMIGLMAGFGVAMKPFFVLTALLVEGVGLLTSRRWQLRTPEIIGVLTVAGLHGLYFVLNPDVFQSFILLVQRLGAGYGAYPATPLDKRLLLLVMSAFITAAPFVLYARRYRYGIVPSSLMLTIGVMGAGSILGYLLQQKGWNYHAIPMMTTNTLLGVLFGLEVFLRYADFTDVRRQNLVRLILVSLSACLAIGVSLFQVMSINRANRAAQEFELFTLAPYITTYTAANERVMMMHIDVMPQFPVLAMLNRRSASRYLVAHPLPIAYWGYEGLPTRDPAHVVPVYAQAYLDSLPLDIAKYHPKLILIQSGGCLPPCSVFNGDMHTYLTERGIMDTAILPDYTLLAVDGGFHVYVRDDLAPQS